LYWRDPADSKNPDENKKNKRKIAIKDITEI
jgi:hypothetical protein